ncbi:MAG: ABC transporter permease [Candidatus Choladocola sp.]|nr:ABC transporter permease [Candidatus Choladocola sp.]
MTVFKGYLLIIRRNLGTILMYISIFVGVAAMIQAMNQNTGTTGDFKNQQLNVAVIDRDGGVLSDTVRKMLEREQKLLEIEDDEQVIQEELFYHNAEYVVIIPEGAENAMENDNCTVQSITTPGSVMSYYVESQVNALLNQIRVYLAGGFTLEKSCERALALGEAPSAVTLIDVNGNAGIREGYNYYTGYMPYAFLGAAVMTLSVVIMEFKKKDIRRRMMSSCVPFQHQNLAAVVSFVLVGAAIWGICVAVQAVLYHGGIFTSGNAGLYVLNSAACMLTALSLGYLSGMIAGSPAALSGINNVISLGLCFLGGVFVPLEMLGDGVKKISQFLPTYWYSVINGILGDYETVSPEMMKTVWKGLVIQVLFAVACFGITMAMRRMRMQEKG